MALSKGVRSARGEIVDFDLLKIKQQIATAPKPTTVQAREDFIDQRLKRRLKKQVAEVTIDPEGLDEEPTVDTKSTKTKSAPASSIADLSGE